MTGYGSATMCLPSGGTLGVEFFNWSNLSDHNYFNNTKLERVIDPGTQEQTAYVVHYPDGAQDVYGFVATNEYNYVIRYCLSSRIDPQGHATRIEYFDFDPAQVNTVVKRIVDPDNHALTFTYANLDLGGGYFKTNFIGQVSDWAGRAVKLGYDVNSLTLTQIVDAANITNKLTYSFDTAWIQSLVTPYGTTTFDHYSNRANYAETRYVTITEPNGAHQRYWYESADSTVPDPLDPLGNGNVVPSGTPFGDSFVQPGRLGRRTAHVV